jgi:hypothetical protein
MSRPGVAAALAMARAQARADDEGAMSGAMSTSKMKELRAPFPPEAIGKLPKAGTTIEYVGHAAVTDRLLEVDPLWTWEPMALTADGLPLILARGDQAELWIRLTVCGVTRLGVGTVSTKTTDAAKQLIGDAIRNAAMRFGVALDLWTREDLHSTTRTAPKPPAASAKSQQPPKPADRIRAQLANLMPSAEAARAWVAEQLDGEIPERLEDLDALTLDAMVVKLDKLAEGRA